MRLTFFGYQVELKTVRNKLTFMRAMSKSFRDVGLGNGSFVLDLWSSVFALRNKGRKSKIQDQRPKTQDHIIPDAREETSAIASTHPLPPSRRKPPGACR